MFFVPIPRNVAKERGLKYYMTNTPCSLGGIGYKSVNNRKCFCQFHKESYLKYDKKWRLSNPDKVKESKRKEYEKHSTLIKNRVKAWEKANSDHVKTRNKLYREKNKDVIKEYRKQYYLENRLAIASKAKLWALSNRDKVRINANRSAHKNRARVLLTTRKRQLRLQKAIMKYSEELNDFVFKEAYLLNTLRKTSSGFSWNVDHMIPLQNPDVCGLHVWNNFQCLPSVMNTSKGNKLIYTNPHEWLYDIPKFFKVVYQQEIAA